MSEPLKDKPQKAEKKIKIHPEGRAKEKSLRIKDPASTHVMHVDEHVTHEDPAATTSPNTYQLGNQTFNVMSTATPSPPANLNPVHHDR